MDMVETAAGLRALLPQGGALIGFIGKKVKLDLRLIRWR